jgi:hypothetical protein
VSTHGDAVAAAVVVGRGGSGAEWWSLTAVHASEVCVGTRYGLERGKRRRTGGKRRRPSSKDRVQCRRRLVSGHSRNRLDSISIVRARVVAARV